MENEINQGLQDKISIYKVKDGRVGVAVSLGTVAGKRVRPTATGKTEAEAKLKLLNKLVKMGAMDAPAIFVNDLSPVEDLIMEFKKNYILAPIPSKRKNSKEPTSSRTNENYLYALSHFEKYFKGYKVREIDTIALNKFFISLATQKKADGTPKMSQVTLDRIEYVVKAMYRRAEKEGFISTDPTSGKDYLPPKSNRETEEVTPLSGEEMQEVLEALKDNIMLYAPILVLATTGLRTEEVLALKWKHLDMDNQVICVRGAITTDVKFDEQGNKVSKQTVCRGTKSTASRRDVHILDPVKEVLLKWKDECQRISQTKTGKEDFVFGNSKGASWTYSGFRSSINKYLARKIPNNGGLRFHRIRHYVGTMMAAAGAGKYNVMSQLGHAKETTTRRYIGYTDKGLVSANGAIIADKIGGIIGG